MYSVKTNKKTSPFVTTFLIVMFSFVTFTGGSGSGFGSGSGSAGHDLLSLFGIANAAGVASTNPLIATPQNVNVEQDDNNAVLSWDGGPGFNSPGSVTNPSGVAGYKITWGPVGGVQSSVLTQYRTIQLQPLINGKPYQAVIQVEDNDGNLGPLTDPIMFTGDPTRVNSLKFRMTGFFDDFNSPEGPVDALKWATAYSECNNSMYSGMFINSQFHVHNMTNATNCDRGQSISRPRGLFDFGGRTGTIAFDMDGENRRDQWYLDLTPSLMDIGGQVNIEGGVGPANPGNVLRFHQNGNLVEILYIDKQGNENSLVKTDFNPYPSLEWIGLTTIPNLRRHWELHISQTSADVTINGQLIVKTPISLDYTKANILWNAFSYNTPKSNEPFMTLHWDNFGFDGPPSPFETHDYLSPNYGTNDYNEVTGGSGSGSGSGPITRTVTIPDPISGTVQTRLMFTLQNSTGHYGYDPTDQVKVNGQTIPMPQPTGTAVDQSILVSSINPYSEVMILPDGLVQTGDNALEFDCRSCGIKNVHLELDFNRGQFVPAYTQPAFNAMPASMMAEALTSVGPGATIDQINGVDTAIQGTASQQTGSGSIDITDTALVKFSATNNILMDATGKNPGISKVELQLDHKPVFDQVFTNPVPAYSGSYNLDIAKLGLTPGSHELYFVAFNTAGNPGPADYFQADDKSGDYYPVKIKVIPSTDNVSTSTSTPNLTSAALVPTSTLISTPTVIPTTTTPATPAKGQALPTGLHVNGNQILDVNGNVVTLRGADRDGTEYACEQGWGISDGPVDLASFQAMAKWGINVVRVPLNEHCWLGLSGLKPDFAGVKYQDAIKNEVQAANQAGIAVILDLHASGPTIATTTPITATGTPGSNFVSGINGQQPMADFDYSLSFWNQVATTFKDNSSVIFDLFNEPFAIDWNCWKNGCQTKATDGSLYKTASMQDLVNAVRSTGATNILMLGGLSWSSDETLWEQNKPIDTLNNLAVSFHLYQFGGCLDPNCWSLRFNNVQNNYPVIAGEIGNTDGQTNFVSDILPWLDSQKMSYLTWTWDAWTNQNLITDYQGTPSQPYGLFYKNYLQKVLVESGPGPIVTNTPTIQVPTSTSTSTSTLVPVTPTATATATATPTMVQTTIVPTSTPTLFPTSTLTKPATATATPTPKTTNYTYTLPGSTLPNNQTIIRLINDGPLIANVTVNNPTGIQYKVQARGQLTIILKPGSGSATIISDQPIQVFVIETGTLKAS